MNKELTLEEMVGANVIYQLESNPRFKEVITYLKNKAPHQADAPTLTEIYARAVHLGLQGKDAEKYAQRLLVRLKSLGTNLVYVAPETIRNFSREAAGVIPSTSPYPILVKKPTETYKKAAN